MFEDWRGKDAYDEWSDQLDAELVHYADIDVCDVDQSMLRSFFDQGMSPQDAAREIMERW